MSDGSLALSQTAEEMRRSFDASFAAVLAPAAPGMRDLLAVRIGSGRYGLDLRDLIGLEAQRTVVPLPTSDSALLGIAGVRGRLVPVYHLRGLLGEGPGLGSPPSSERESERAYWLAICNEAQPLGLAFDVLEGQIRLSQADFFAAQAGAASRYVAEAFVWAGVTRHVLNVRSIIETIRERAGIVDVPRE